MNITLLKTFVRKMFATNFVAKAIISVVLLIAVSIQVASFILPQTHQAQAAINLQINYQGKLTNTSDVAVANGDYNMEFILYDAPSGGTTLWTETRTGANKVTVTNGLFSVMLGSVTALTGVDFNQTVYLGVNIGGTGSPSWDGEMTPRKTIGSVPSAFLANGVVGTGGVRNTIDSATALTIAKAGSNYALQVDTSAGSAATGLKVTSNAASSGLALAVISSGSNENLTIDAKGSGTISLGATSTGNLILGGSTGDILLGGGSGSTGCTVTNSTGAFACTAGGSFTTLGLTGAVSGGTSFTGSTFVKAPYIYGGDMTTTYGGYSGGVFGGTTTHAVLDFVDNGSRVGEFYTTSSTFNFFTDVGKALNFYTNADYGGAPAFGIDTSHQVILSSLDTDITAPTTSGTTRMVITDANGQLSFTSAAVPSGTNTGDVTLAAFGSTANANGASLSGQALTLQPASASFPGGVSTTTQSFAGDKTFVNNTTFTGTTTQNNTATFNTDVDLVFAGTENLSMTSTITGTTAVDLFSTTVTNQTSSGTQRGIVLTNANDAANAVTESLILIDNAETTASTLTDAILITSSGVNDGITDAIDASASNITNAINIGANAIAGTNFSVTGAGAVTAVGVNSGSGLLQGTGGLTLTGAVSITNNGSSTIDLNTGTSTGLVTIGGGSGTFSLQTTNIDISNTGAITNATGFNGLIVTANTGVITTGTWNGTAVGAQYGGTGLNTSASSGVPSINSGTWSANAITPNGVMYGGASNALSFTAVGSTGQCLVGNTGAAPSWSSCAGLVTLQAAYDATSGNTITTTTGRNIAFTLAEVTTPTSFTIENQDTAATSVQRIFNSIASGTATNGLLIEQTGAGTLTNGIQIAETAGTITDGILITGTLGNILNSGSIDITGAGAITGATGISSSGTIAFSGLSTNGAVYTTGGTGTLNSEVNLDVTRGGTGVGTFTTNGVIYGAGTSDLLVTTQGAANTVLVANAGAPSFSDAITVGTSVTSPTINATTALQLGGANINTAGTLTNVAYLNQSNAFTNANAITVSSATAFTVAKSGANYVLQVSTNAPGSYTGLKIVSTDNAGVQLSTIGGTNEGMIINALGTGEVQLGGTSTGNILLGGGSGSTGCTVTNSTGAFACTAGGSFTTMALTGAVTGAASFNGLVITANTGVITTGTWNGTAVTDTYVADTLTVDSSSSVHWNALNNYPAACSAGSAISQLADTTNTCTAFNTDTSITLQDAYGATSGNTITTTDARNLAITLAEVTTPTSFTIENQDTAATSVQRIFNSIASGTATNGLLIEQTGAGTLTNGIQIAETAGTITDGILITGTLGNILNSGSIDITGAGAITGATGIVSSGNYVQSAGTFSLTSANTTQTTTSSAAAINVNSLTTGTGLYVASSSLSSGKLIDLQVSGTAAASNTQTVLNVATSGANGTSTQTTYGGYFSNTHTGTASTNVAAYFTASGGTNNYAAIFNGGNVGVNTTTPTQKLEVSQGNIKAVGVQAPTGFSGTATTGGSLATNNYYYAITSVDATGESSPTYTYVNVGGANNAVNLSWSASPLATSYNIYRSTSPTGVFVSYNTASTSFNDTGAAGGSSTPPLSGTALGQIQGNSGISIYDSQGSSLLSNSGFAGGYANGPRLNIIGSYFSFGSSGEGGGNGAQLRVYQGLDIAGSDNTYVSALNFKSYYGDAATFSAQPRSGQLFLSDAGSSNRFYAYPGVADGASAVGYTLDTSNSLANASAKLLAVRNQGSEKITVLANGNFGIGTTAPSSSLHVLKADNGTDDIVKILANNLTQGIGISYNTITAIGSNTDQNIIITPKGAGDIITTAGTLGVGYTPTTGTATLMVNGGAAIGDGTTLDATIPTNGLLVKGSTSIGSTTATSMFNVGTAAQFQVNSSGAIAAATGVTSSGTITFSGLGGGGTKCVQTDNSGVITAAAAACGSGGGLTVGSTAISSGTAGRILFEGSGNVLQEAAGLAWDNTDASLVLSTSSTTASNKALSVSQTGGTTGTDYAGYFSNTGSATTNIAGYFTASGATNNYAAIFDAGNVGIGTTTPTNLSGTYFGTNQVNPLWVSANDGSKVTSLVVQGNLGEAIQFVDQTGAAEADFGVYTTDLYFVNRQASGGIRFVNATSTAMYIDPSSNVGIGTGVTSLPSLLSVGTSSVFQVNSSGAIAAATGILSSGTIRFSSLTSNGPLYTSAGNGTLTTTAPTSGAIGYWSRSSTTISPTTANDIILQATANTTGADLGITNTGVYTGTGIFNLTANSATTGTLASITGNALTTGSLLSLSSSSTAATTGQKGLNVALTGALTGAQTTYGGYFSNTRTGASAVNVGLYATASGATGANYAAIFDAGNVGIGTTTPTSKLGVVETYSTTNGTYNGVAMSLTSSGNITAGSGIRRGLYVNPSISGTYGTGLGGIYSGKGIESSVNFTGTIGGASGGDTYNLFGMQSAANFGGTIADSVVGANVKGLEISSTGNLGTSGSTKHYGLNIDSVAGTADTNYGIFINSVASATDNYALITNTTAGNVGIGDTTPTALLTVGSGDLFQVNSSGAIAAATGIVSSGTIQFSSLTSNGPLYTSAGNGTLTTTAPTSGAIGYWSRSTTILDTATAGDLIRGTGGLTITGATVSLNDSSNFGVSIAGGTSTGTITLGGTGASQSIQIGTGVAAKTIAIGNSTDDTFSINSSAFTVSTAGAVSGVTGYIQGSGTMSLTSANTTQTTTSSVMAVNASSLTSGTGIYAAAGNSLTSGKLVDLQISSTGSLTGQTALNIATAGTNGTGGQTTYGIQVANTHTGTSTNVAGYFTASGGSSNYGLVVPAGTVGIGTATPSGANGILQVSGDIGMTGNTYIRQSTNSDGNTLTILATQVVAANSNANGYGYSGGGLLASNSPSGSALLLDVGATTAGTAHRLKVTNDGSGVTGTLFYGTPTLTTLYADSATSKVGVGTSSLTGNLTITQTATATGALKGIVYTGAVNTNQTLSTEIPSLTLTTAGRQWATGALTMQREVLITQPTYSFVGASTITDAATVGIAGAPIKSTNASITNTHALLIQGGAVSTATNSYGLTVNAQTGATNNYAAAFLGGNVGIGIVAPATQLDIDSNSNSSSIRIRGLAETTEIADIYVGASGKLLIDTTAGSAGQGFIELKGEDDQYGVIIRDSNGASTGYANLFMNDTTNDTLNICLNCTSNTPGMVLYEVGAGDYRLGLTTLGPDRRLDSLDASNPQIRLTTTDGSVYSDLQNTATANLIVTGDSLTSSSTKEYGLQISPVINQTSTASYTALDINVTETAATTLNGLNRLADFRVGSSSKLAIANDGSVTLQNASSLTTAYGGFGKFENHLTKSEEFDHANWTKSSVTAPTANAQTAPDGSSTAESLATSGSGGYVQQDTSTAVSSTDYTFSVWARSASGTQSFSMRVDGTTTGTGTEVTHTATTSWQRFSVTQAVGSFTGNVRVRIYPGTSGSTGTIYAWGAQVEKSSVPNTYAKTTTAGLTNDASRGLIVNNNLKNTTASGFLYGGRQINVIDSTTAGTHVGQFIRMVDNTSLDSGQTVRGLEVQAYSGTNVNGTNTGIAAYGYTFGIQATTTSQAAAQATPAAIFADLDNGTDATTKTRGNAIRAYTDNATSADLVSFYQETSAYTGNGLLMNFGNGGGSFSGNFMNLQNAATSKYTISSAGRHDLLTADADNVISLYINSEESTVTQTLFAIESDTTGNGQSVDTVKAHFEADGSLFVSLTGTQNTVALCHANNGQSNNDEIVDCSGAPSDVAEYFGSEDPTLGAGEIVVVGKNATELHLDGYHTSKAWVARSTGAYQNTLMGVISTAPAAVYGDEIFSASDNPRPVALAGRVPVKVNLENGPIKAGDFITSSSVPGIGMKAVKAGPVIGQALNDYDGTGNAMVIIFVKATNYSGVSINEQISGLVFDYSNPIQSAQTSSQILEYLVTQLANLDSDNLSQVHTDVVIANGEIITPTVTTQTLRTDFLSSAAADGGLSVASTTMFNGGLMVDSIHSIGDLISFQNDVEFFGTPYFTSDTAGFAVIKAGVQTVDVRFTREYLAQPIVNASFTFEQEADLSGITDSQALAAMQAAQIASAQAFLGEGVTFAITNKTKEGFTIVLNKVATTDVKFSWTALAVRNASTFMSIDAAPETPPVVEPPVGDVPTDPETPPVTEPDPTP